MNWRGLLIGGITLLVGLIVLALLSREQAGKNQPREARLDDRAAPRSDFYMEGVLSRHFNRDGRLSHELSAPRIDYFLDAQTSQMQQPQIRLAPADGQLWQLSATLANANHASDTLWLQQDVRLIRPAPDGAPTLQMTTDQLNVNLLGRTADTDGDVKFTSPGGQVTATGLRANLDTEQLELLANVQGHYEPPIP